MKSLLIKLFFDFQKNVLFPIKLYFALRLKSLNPKFHCLFLQFSKFVNHKFQLVFSQIKISKPRNWIVWILETGQLLRAFGFGILPPLISTIIHVAWAHFS